MPRLKPLEPPQLETFVRAYRNSYDGHHAAAKAGYESPAVIWPELLARPDVQARLRYYRAGVDVPDLSRAGLVSDFLAKISVDLSSLIKVDPATGVPSYDLRNANAAQLGALEIKETIRQQGRKTMRTVQIQPRSVALELQALIRNLGLHEPNANAGVDRLTAAIMEINRRGSSAPIADFLLTEKGKNSTDFACRSAGTN